MSLETNREGLDKFDLKAILATVGLDPSEVAVAFHKPSEPWKRRALCMLAQEDPEAFNAYQSTHPQSPQATLKKRRYLASFVPGEHGGMVFVGVFENCGAHKLGGTRIVDDPAFLRLTSILHRSSGEETVAIAINYAERFRFELFKTELLKDLIGRLVVEDPGARAYMRLAEKLSARVIEIKQASLISPPMPAWDEVVIFASEFRALPREWALRLSEWRGVYLIVDQADGARYVGSAYGETNLLGRWSTHVAGEFGVTAELSKRRVFDFRFSILELLAPTSEASAVIACEHKWMRRLDTVENGLNT